MVPFFLGVVSSLENTLYGGHTDRPFYPVYLLRSYQGYSIYNRWQTFNSSYCAINTDIGLSFFLSFFLSFIHSFFLSFFFFLFFLFLLSFFLSCLSFFSFFLSFLSFFSFFLSFFLSIVFSYCAVIKDIQLTIDVKPLILNRELTEILNNRQFC